MAVELRRRTEEHLAARSAAYCSTPTYDSQRPSTPSYDNKWSKNFDKRPHRHLDNLRGGEQIRPTLSPIYYMAPWAHMSYPHKRHLDRFSRFCVQRCKGSQCFSMGRTIPKIAPSLWAIGTPLESAPHSISIGSAVFAGITNVTNRYRERKTDHAFYI